MLESPAGNAGKVFKFLKEQGGLAFNEEYPFTLEKKDCIFNLTMEGI